jgi:hypothetical protein
MVAKFNSKTHLQNTFFRFFEPVTSKFAIMCYYDKSIFFINIMGIKKRRIVMPITNPLKNLQKSCRIYRPVTLFFRVTFCIFFQRIRTQHQTLRFMIPKSNFSTQKLCCLYSICTFC